MGMCFFEDHFRNIYYVEIRQRWVKKGLDRPIFFAGISNGSGGNFDSQTSPSMRT